MNIHKDCIRKEYRKDMKLWLASTFKDDSETYFIRNILGRNDPVCQWRLNRSIENNLKKQCKFFQCDKKS